MQLRTFRAKTMAQALADVRRELGPDAVIVHTRSFKIGGVLGVGAKEEVEIIASYPAAPASKPAAEPRQARPTPNPMLARAYAKPETKAISARPAPRGDRPQPAFQPGQPITAESVAELLKVRQRGAIQSRLNGTHPKTQPEPAPPAIKQVAKHVISAATNKPSSDPQQADLHEELRLIKRMVGELATSRPSSPGVSVPRPKGREHPPVLAEWYVKLIENAVSRELADQIVADVRGSLSPAQLADDSATRRAILQRIEALMPAVPCGPAAIEGKTPRVMALVGPTGVGKTTTIAKLAAQYKLVQGASVGLITCDVKRLGAIDQLRQYADVVGVPFKVAGNAAEMAAARRSLAGCDVILVDTPGIAASDTKAIEELAEILAPAQADEVHLAVPGSFSERSALAAAGAFEGVGVNRLLFTKLDEAVTYGILVNVAAAARVALSYVTTGPRFPEQVEVSVAPRLAEMVLTGAAA